MQLLPHQIKEKLSTKLALRLLSEMNASLKVGDEHFEFYLGTDPEEPIFFLDMYSNKGHIGYLDFYMWGGGARCDVYKQYEGKPYLSPRRAFGIHVFPQHTAEYKGLGTTLVALATRIAKEKGAKHFEFRSVIGTEGEQEFYRKIGGLKGPTQRSFLRILERMHPNLVELHDDPIIVQEIVKSKLPTQTPWRFLMTKRAEEDGYTLPYVGIEKRKRKRPERRVAV